MRQRESFISWIKKKDILSSTLITDYSAADMQSGFTKIKPRPLPQSQSTTFSNQRVQSILKIKTTATEQSHKTTTNANFEENTESVENQNLEHSGGT